MTRKGGESVKELLWGALEVERSQRRTWLDGRCGGDPALRARLEQLLAAHERALDVLGTPTMPAAAGPDLEPGQRVGPYRVLRVAGSGGFGTVYLAEQTEPVTRRVALKVLRSGLDSEVALARFDAERQALARMEHPGIAQVFDAGTTGDGRPYFAMEFVAGTSITEYCGEHGVGLRARLELFRSVCQAVQHAHQKGVVHRDLKPSNVLVTEVDRTPHPKVIDFGVAKALEGTLTELSLVSVEGALMGTPVYMSPEQAAGEVDVDTRTDVYALGAMLYELVCGSPPFDFRGAGLPALLRAVAEDDPRRPSERAAPSEGARGSGRVPPEIDWITMRCLDKDRSRRYPSANALATDIDRFLEGRPVEAAPPSRWYRLRKATRRHRFAVAAAAALLLALVAGTAGTSVGLVRANRAKVRLEEALERIADEAARARAAEARAAEQAERAVAQAQVARAVNAFVTDDLLAPVSPAATRGRSRDVSLREVFDLASARIDQDASAGGRFADKPLVEAAIRDVIGSVYSDLGEPRSAVRHLRRVHSLRLAELGERDRTTLEAASRLARALYSAGEHESAEELLLPTLGSQIEVLGDDSPATLASERSLALLRHGQGRPEEAYQILRASYERAERALSPLHRTTVQLLGSLAVVAQASGRDAEASELFRESLARHRLTLGDGDPATVAAMVNLATFLRTRSANEEAAELLTEAHARQLEIFGADHPATLTGLLSLGLVNHALGRVAEAEAMLRRALEGFERSAGPDHADTYRAMAALARSLETRGERQEAERLFRRALEGTRALLGHDHPDTDGRRKDLANFLLTPGGPLDEVGELLEESFESQRRNLGPRHPNTLRSLTNLALLRHRLGDETGAEALHLEALEGLREVFGPDHIEVLAVESTLAGFYVDTGRPEEGERLARRAVEVGERQLPADDYDLARFRLRLALGLRDLGRYAEAREQCEAALGAVTRTRGPEDTLAVLASDGLQELDRLTRGDEPR